MNGPADVIATFNVRDFQLEIDRFGIDVAKPGEVLRRLEAKR